MLALNIAWFDRGPVLLGALATALHHLFLLYLLPYAVFPGEGDLARVLLHAVIVIFQMAVLIWVVDMVQQTFGRMTRLSNELIQKGAALEERTQEAEAASRAISMFLANISHEIRTPINAILGFSHLLLRAALNPRQRDQVGKINAAGVALLRLINDVLDFTKIEAGKLEFDETEFNLRAAIGSQVQLISESAHAKGLELNIHVDRNIPDLLLGDDLRFNQVILNLLSNAIKFTPEGRITLTAEMVELKDGIAGIRCAVHDTGIGMTADQQSMMFNSFAQGDASTTRRFGGAGLGLAICRQIAEQMGGWIRVESHPGKGSTFTFLVRMRLVAHGALPRAQVSPTLRHLRVLIADDNPSARQIIQEIFARGGMQADLAGSGPKAIEMLRANAQLNHPYDLLLIDWKMPVVDGFETLDRMRAAGVIPEPVTVMMTAYDLDECMQQGIGKRIGGYISKPVDDEKLCATLNDLFAPTMPAAGPRHLVAEIAVPPAPAPAGLPPALVGQRVLLVEDNEINREIATELLRDAGLVVDCAENGRIACEMLETGKLVYTAVMMDVQMPEMDGVSATRRIRRRWSAARLPIIAMTAHAYEEDRRRCLEAGMNDHVSKPVDPQMLMAALERWLPRSADRAPSAAQQPAPPAAAALPEALPPFDLPAALANVNGKALLLRRLIFGFRDNYADICERISDPIESGDYDEAGRLAHGLRGVAASLGLAMIAAGARQIEEGLRAGQGQGMAALLPGLDRDIRAAMEAVDRLDGTAAGSAPQMPAGGVDGAGASGGQVIDLAAVSAARDLLRDQIGRQSLSARRSFQNFAEAVGMGVDERDADPIGDALMRLDYDEALALLDAYFADLESGQKDISA